MEVYLINLDRRPDRLEFFREQAAARGFSFKRIAAVDGSDPALQERANTLGPGFFCDRLSPFELACFESHRNAWRSFWESGEQFGLIMEDDLVLAEDFSGLLDARWIPEDADLVRLETFLTLTYFDPKAVTNVGRRRVHRMRSSMLGGGAYIVSREKAAALLTATAEVVDPLDHVLFDSGSSFFKGSVIYQMIPAPAIQGRKLIQSTKRSWAEAETETWTKSSLEGERLAIRGMAAKPTGLRAYRVWRRIDYRLQRLRARLQGRLLSPVPFK